MIEAGNAHTWRAQPKQREFLTLKCKEAMYGGAAGGGKSDALLIFAILYAQKYHGSKILILRRTLQELQKEGSLIPRSLELLSNTGWQYRDQKKKWYAPNGSVIEFGYCEAEKDVYQYQSAQYEVIIFDELTHFTEFQYLYMFSRCRSAKGFPACVRSATNPGNIGHAWVKKRFVTVCPPGQVHRSELKNPVTGKMETVERCFIPARVWDNKILLENDPGYLLFLQALPENERRALLDGDWDVFKGQYFGEWRYDLHVCKPFEIPEDWHRERAFDWGMAKPLAHYWVAVNPQGKAYVYREYYKTGKTAQVAAQEILALSAKEKYRFTHADPSIFSKKGEGPESIGEQMRRIMGPIMPSKNDRINGWMAVRKWLEIAPDGLPWLQVFDTCENLIRTLPEQIYDEIDVEDLNTDGEDHAVDAIRYWAVMRHAPPKEKEADRLKDLPLKDQGFWERWNAEQKLMKRKEGIQSLVEELGI